MQRTSNVTSLSGLLGLAAVVVAVIVFFFTFLLPFLGQLQAGLQPLLAMLG